MTTFTFFFSFTTSERTSAVMSASALYTLGTVISAGLAPCRSRS